MDDKLSQVQQQVKDICVFLHTEFVSMVRLTQKDSEDDSFMDLEEVLALDLMEALDHIAAAVKELMGAKRELRELKNFESDASEKERYERALQKVESEVRNHIKVRFMQVEQQLKLHIEHLEQKLSDCDKVRAELTASYESVIEDMRKDNSKLSDLIKSKEKEVVELRAASLNRTTEMFGTGAAVHDLTYTDKGERPKLTQDVLMLKHNSRRDAAKMQDMERKILHLEEELKRAESEFGDKQRECDKWKKEFEVLHVTMRNKEHLGLALPDEPKAEYYKKRYEEKCNELLLLEKRLTRLTRTSRRHDSRRSLKRYSAHREMSTRDSRTPSPVPSTLKRNRSIETKDMYTQLLPRAVVSTRLQKKVMDNSISWERLRREKPRPSSNMRFSAVIAHSSRK